MILFLIAEPNLNFSLLYNLQFEERFHTPSIDLLCLSIITDLKFLGTEFHIWGALVQIS